MPNPLLDGLSSVDATGRLILTATLVTLLLSIAANWVLRARYSSLERDLKRGPDPNQRFAHKVLNHIVRDAESAWRRSREANTQAIIEDNVQADLRSLLLAERFIKASTGLVIILGLLGTFYGLTLSIGRLVHLVSADTGGVADVSQAVTTGLTQALTGMAVAFSNSLFGIVSAVILTVVGVLSNVADRRTAWMIQVETYLDRLVSARAAAPAHTSLDPTVAAFADAVAKLERSTARFESALQAFLTGTSNFREFNVQIVGAKPRDER